MWKNAFHVFLVLGCLTRLAFFVVFEVYTRDSRHIAKDNTTEGVAAHHQDGTLGSLSCHIYFRPGDGNIFETTFDIATYFFFAGYCIVLCSLAEIYYHTKDSIAQQRASIFRAIQSANRFETLKDEKVDKHKTKLITLVCIICMLLIYIISTVIVSVCVSIERNRSVGSSSEFETNGPIEYIKQIPLYVIF